MNLGDYRFEDPWFFWFLLIIPLIVGWYIWKYKNRIPEHTISSITSIKGIKRPWKARFRHALFSFRILAIALIIIALARPQKSFDNKKVTTEGIDIVIALDISSSMLAMDFKPDRLEASKSISQDFVKGRANDRIGLVVFAAESFTQCPITTDHKVLTNLISEIKSGIIEDGTAIGLGLSTAIDRLKDSGGKSKVVILLTDGENNTGFINPMTAVEIAQTFGVRIYTIGVGTIGTAPYPVQTPFGMSYQDMEVRIDEDLLQDIASLTNGAYFRATSNNKLKEIYEEINKMEKNKIEVEAYQRFSDKYLIFALIASVLLFLELFLRNSLLKSFP
ncbi:MAG: VWA domain-containing protein [Bacteroidetes bacterium]|nr:VWA domain-containing protein [Bacteroidota bacterium]MBL6962756.1 VWA domain-containing protein [Bacteroidota bacterium]